MRNISAVVLTYNSSYNIKRCLESVQWADEIVVIDSFSIDETVSIAKQHNAKVIEREYSGYSRQIEFGMQNSKNEWILILDSDEEVSGELRQEIESLDEKSIGVTGFEIPRHVFFIGKWINHGGWYPDYQFRLFDRRKADIKHYEVHGSFQSQSKSKLKGKIYHYTYRNLFDYIERINKYTSLETGNTVLGRGLKPVKWYNLLLNPLSKFLRMYFVHKGFKDGMQGLILALFSAFYTLASYAKLWEYKNSVDNKLELPPITNKDFKNYNKLV